MKSPKRQTTTGGVGGGRCSESGTTTTGLLSAGAPVGGDREKLLSSTCRHSDLDNFYCPIKERNTLLPTGSNSTGLSGETCDWDHRYENCTIDYNKKIIDRKTTQDLSYVSTNPPVLSDSKSYDMSNIDVFCRPSENNELRCAQINLHRSLTPVQALNEWMNKGKITNKIAFIQEPYLSKNFHITGLSKNFAIFQGKVNCKVRSCLMVSKNLNGWQLNQFSNEDITTVAFNLDNKIIVLCSAYFAHDSADLPPPNIIKELTEFCNTKGWGLLIAADANSHLEAWGSTNSNSRGESIYDYMLEYDISILNRGREATFINAIREEVIDITLCNNRMVDLIKDWVVSKECSFSDHRRIEFNIGVNTRAIDMPIRNVRKTDWDKFEIELESRIDKLETVNNLDELAEGLTNIIQESYERSCPTTRPRRDDKPIWWSKKLEKMKKQVAKLNKRYYQIDKSETNRVALRKSYSKYKKEKEKARTRSWQSLCEGMKDLAAPARLQRLMKLGGKKEIGTVRDKEGNFSTTPLETLNILLEHHFPDRDRINEVGELDFLDNVGRIDRNMIDKIVCKESTKAAIDTFGSFKSPGVDGVYPIMLQKGFKVLSRQIELLYKKCLEEERVPKAWLESRVAFIPKPAKIDYTEPKSYRPISLSSFLLKGLERLIYWHIQDTTFKQSPLNKNIFSYREGMGTEEALHNLVRKIEKAKEKGEICIILFLDISGAFNNASVSSILNSMKKKGIDNSLIRWFKYMLENRISVATLQGVTARKKSDKGTPQGGISSAGISWNLLSEDLYSRFPSRRPTELNNFADDYLTVSIGIDLNTVMDNIKADVKILQDWARDTGLTFSAEKTKLMMITNKKITRKPDLLINGQKIEWVDQYKYLGVTIDKDLNWNKHVNNITKKANLALLQSKSMISKKIGLSPKVCNYIYRGLILPTLTYASIVWIKSSDNVKHINALRKIQRRGLTMTLNAMRSTPTMGMEVMLDIRPIDIHLKQVALNSYIRMRNNGNWRAVEGEVTGGKNHSVIMSKLMDSIPELDRECDKLTNKERIRTNFITKIDQRDAFKDRIVPFKPDNDRDINCFTDGSKTDDGAGAGYIIIGKDIKHGGSHSVSIENSVFQTEVLAIKNATDYLLDIGAKDRNIKIQVDNQAAIRALGKYTITSKLVSETKSKINRLAERNSVEIRWVPGHSGILGNNIADGKARIGSKNLGNSMRTKLPLSQAYFKSEIKNWGRKLHQERWDNRNNCRQTGMFLPNIENKTWKVIRNMSRKNVAKATQIITGHNTLQRHLSLMFQEETPTCQRCELEPETIEHVIRHCPAYTETRREVLGEFFLKDDLDKYKIKKIFTFMNKIKRINFEF